MFVLRFLRMNMTGDKSATLKYAGKICEAGLYDEMTHGKRDLESLDNQKTFRRRGNGTEWMSPPPAE